MSDTNSHRIAVAHASPVVQQGVEHVLERHARLHYVGSVQDADRMGELISSHRPDIVLVEYEQACRSSQWSAAFRRYERVRVVLYGRTRETQAVITSLHLGAVGFVHDTVPLNDLVQGFLDVMRGRTFLHLGESQSATFSTPAHSTHPIDGMTARERQVYGLLLLRHANDEIAERLAITQQTAKNYVSRVFHKLGVSSRRELLRLEAPLAALSSAPSPQRGRMALPVDGHAS